MPTLFNHVKLGDSIYVDGGVTNNYPVEELRLMGVDFIIVIDVQDTLKTINDLKSAIEILGQVGNYSAIEAMIEKRKNTDIYIRPNITDFSVVSFREKSEIIAAGLNEALSVKNQLIKLAAKQKRAPRNEEIVNFSDSLIISGIQIDGNSHYTRSYIL